MKKPITVFKIRIDSIKEHAIGFELFSGTQVRDTYVNVIAKGGYGLKSRLLLTPKQFADFAHRLIAYVYTTKKVISDEELIILWNLRLNIFNNEAQQISGSLFAMEKTRLKKLGLTRGGKKNEKK